MKPVLHDKLQVLVKNALIKTCYGINKVQSLLDDTKLDTPILYSFRRCPYCIRTHMALHYSERKIILREVALKKLPAEVLAVSSQATVPALVIDEKVSMTESWDIMKWALQENDPDNWLGKNKIYQHRAEPLIELNDFSFKPKLDKYKYADRYPEQAAEYYRKQCENFLVDLELLLAKNKFLFSQSMSIADVAVFPFIRQFAMVDMLWFDESPYPALRQWLNFMLDTLWFRAAFKKHEVWETGDENLYL